MTRALLSQTLPWVAAAGLALIAAPARAQNEEAQLKQGKKLYDEALPLLDAKKYDVACPKLEEAARLVPVAVGARLALGECDEGRGRLASALASYKKAQSLAESTGQPDRAKTAAARVAQIEPRVATLRIQLREPGPGLVVMLDGRALSEPERAAPIPVDAGNHTIRATAPDKSPFEVSIDVKDGDRATTNIVFEQGTSPGPTATPPPTAAPSTSPLRIVGIVTAGAGVLALGAGGAFGGLAISKNDQSYADGCVRGGGCPPPGVPSRQAAYDAAAVSTGLFIGGGVLAAAGVVLFLAAPSPSPSPKSGAGQLGVRVSPGGVAIEGAFQ